MTTWNLSNVHSQTGVLTKNSSGNWSYTPTDSDNPVNEYITQSNGTVTWYQVHDGQNYPRYTWPDTISSGDIVAADGTTAANFTHNWGHTSLGTGVLTILINSSGPTVTSHYYVELTENAKVLTSDTVQSSDFTFLKGTASHTPTNMNLIALSDGTGYVYDYMDNATTDLYTATIDSQPVSHFYYDSSWTLSPQSYTGRTTNSTRILNVLGTIPSLTNMTYSTTVWNSDAPTRASDNRYLSVRFQKSPSTNKPANELYVYFFVFGFKILNISCMSLFSIISLILSLFFLLLLTLPCFLSTFISIIVLKSPPTIKVSLSFEIMKSSTLERKLMLSVELFGA